MKPQPPSMRRSYRGAPHPTPRHWLPWRNDWGRVGLVLVVLYLSNPFLHFLRQSWSGYPLDPAYFQSELSPQKLLHLGLYNGAGGQGWQMGKPLTSFWQANTHRNLPELRAFALRLVNRDRVLNGLTPLMEDPDLTTTAQLHAQDMFDRDYFDHITPEGLTPLDRYLKVAVGRVAIGENIAQQQGVPAIDTMNERQMEELERGWMYSNGHRENILTPEFTHFGFGLVTGADGRLYAVQLFGY